MPVTLSETERTEAGNLLNTTGCAKTYHRVQALRWLDEGWRIRDIAPRLQVTRYTVANWRSRFLQRRSLSVAQWFPDDPRSGRPRIGGGQIDGLVNGVIDQDPRDLGYQATTWTALFARSIPQRGSSN